MIRRKPKDSLILVKVRKLPVAANVCGQVLREVEKQPTWSMAHVIMNPMAESLLHKHREMTEIYVITKGHGEALFDVSKPDDVCRRVVAGSAFDILPGVPHMLKNIGGGYLEHLVFALPPFNPADVEIIKDESFVQKSPAQLFLSEPQDCFDGAKIISYDFSHLGLSVALGWVTSDLMRRKKPHYHKRTTEFAYVVEGKGFVNINRTLVPIQSGDWLRVNPGTEHGFVNESPEDLVVVCVCSPAFQMEDVHYSRR
ncbi:MAG: cupin domain-containing protein [Patescibacteria group bacterium]|jgi:mannose-6-phosphate isomerase-like protein (cupin superfamily)